MQEQTIIPSIHLTEHDDMEQSRANSEMKLLSSNRHDFKLISQDNTTFVIKRDYLCISKFFTDLFKETPDASEFKMDSSSDVIKYFVEYLNQHKGFCLH